MHIWGIYGVYLGQKKQPRKIPKFAKIYQSGVFPYLEYKNKNLHPLTQK